MTTGAKGGAAARVLRGAGALALSSAVSSLGQIAIVPLAIRSWGAEGYGEWVTLTAFVTFLGLSDLGIQIFAVNRMCASHAQGRLADLIDDLHSALRIQVPLTAGLACAIATGLAVLPAERWLGLRLTGPTEAYLTVLLLSLELLLGVPMGLVAGVYRATERLPRAALIDASRRGLGLVATLVVLWFGAGPVQLAATRLTMAVATSVFLLFDLRATYSWFRLWPPRGSVEAGARLAAGGVLFLLIPLADYVAQQGVLLILQRSGAGLAVAQFSTHRTAINAAGLLAGLVSNAVWPELTRLDAYGDRAGMARAFGSMARVSIWIVGMAVILLLPVTELVYPLWTRRRLELDVVTLTVLGARMVIWACYGAAATALGATNRRAWMLAAYVVNAVAVTGLTALLVPIMGARGAAVSVAVGEGLTLGWMLPIAAGRVMNLRPREMASIVVPMGLMGVAAPCVLGAAVFVALPPGHLALLLGSGTALVGAVLGGWSAVGARERQLVRDGAARLVGRVRA